MCAHRGELLEGLRIGVVAAGFGLGTGAHGCGSEGGDVIAEGGTLAGGEGYVDVAVEDAECECELREFAVGHHHIGLEMSFRRTHAREIDAIACAPVVLAEI